MNIELTVIIPAYNEEKEIQKTLVTVGKFLQQEKILHEIIVVDDGSIDRTSQRVRGVQKRSPHIKLLKNSKNLGKGAAIKKGALAAKGSYILFTDVDLSSPIEQYLTFRKYLRKGYDLVFGSRYIAESQILNPQTQTRRNLGRVFYFLVHKFIMSGVKDTNCGFKAYTKKTARFLFSKQRLSGWGFDTELLFIAQKNNLRIKEVPIKWYDSSYSRVRIVPAIIGTLKELILLKFHDWQGIYDR